MPLLALLFLLCAPPTQAREWHYPDAQRIVAVGDVHGAYGALVTTLQHAAVIDDQLNWSGGRTHLVITGDLLDRGAESRRVMDLVMRLEKEAQASGGRVHQLLGNHEVMNLIGDLRYVADEEYAAFLDSETPEEREDAYRKYRANLPADSDESKSREEFDKLAPPGFFGHRRAFRSDGKYGKWLLERPFVVVVDGTAFVHGGLPPFIVEHGLKGANKSLKNDLRRYVITSEELVDKGTLLPTDQFKQVPGLLGEAMEEGELTYASAKLADRAIDLSQSPLHGPAGPTWYRGTASCNALVEGDALDAALDTIGAHRVAIGHTSTITRNVQQRMGGRVIEIDTGMLHKVYRGSGNALVIEGDAVSVVNQDGRTSLTPLEHPVRVGHESLAITDGDLEKILAQGKVGESRVQGPNWQLVRLAAGKASISAIHVSATSENNALPELAAYKLDRMLGLNMVPVTVRRDFEDEPGSLQFVPKSTRTERDRVSDDERWITPCPLYKQAAAMRVFDALIQNPARTPSTMLFSTEDWNLMLIEHGNAFGPNTEDSLGLQRAALAVGNEWRAALRELTDDRLNMSLDGILTKQQINDLAWRRDELIRLSLAERK